MKKTISLVVAGLFACATLFSQEKGTSEVSARFGVGMQSLNYKMNQGSKSNRIGGSFAIGYNYYLNSSWSIGSGLEVASQSAKAKLNQYHDAYTAFDMEEEMLFDTRSKRLSETQKLIYMSIPILAQYELPVIGAHKFYAQGGFKVGFPISKKFETKNATFQNEGHYANSNVVMDEQQFAGLGTHHFGKIKDDMGLKVSCQLTLETGIKWSMKYGTSLYTGVYFNYGLNDIRKNTGRHLLQYNSTKPQDFAHNSMLESTNQVGTRSEAISGKVRPMAVGLKISLGIKL